MLLASWCVPSSAQQVDKVAKELGLTPENKALPFNAAPSGDERAALGRIARNMAPSTFVVGVRGKAHGTAWVLSKENRLLATNAHVADILIMGDMIAVQNGTAKEFRVVKAWYHPGVRRFVKGLSIRSSDPREGKVDGRCPDVAVLQLADGAELPAAWPMADYKDFASLFGQPVGMVGFPGHDTQGVPKGGDRAQATFHDGMVSRLSDFRLNPGASDAELQFLQYTIPDWGGFSGSPVYLPNGKVVALHNWVRYAQDANEKKPIQHGVRVDCLWELLVHHGLEKQVAFKIDKGKLDIARWLKEDERDKKFRKAIALVSEARFLVYTKLDFRGGLAKTKEAAELAPTYADIYDVRVGAYTNQWFKHRGQFTAAENRQLLENALEEAKTYAKLAGSSDPYAYLNIALACNNLGYVSGNQKLNSKALELANVVIDTPNVTAHAKASAWSARGVALSNLDEEKAALAAHNTACKTYRDDPIFYENRAEFLVNNRGFKNFIDSDRMRAKLLREKRNSAQVTWRDFHLTQSSLTKQDARDRVRTNSYHKVHVVKLEAGVRYMIDLYSDSLDTYLRVEDSDKNVLAEDDDSGGNLDSLLFFTPEKTGDYRIIATTFENFQTGEYALRIQAGR
jgi:tetratricopeptide (TPR) repeat protein